MRPGTLELLIYSENPENMFPLKVELPPGSDRVVERAISVSLTIPTERTWTHVP